VHFVANAYKGPLYYPPNPDSAKRERCLKVNPGQIQIEYFQMEFRPLGEYNPISIGLLTMYGLWKYSCVLTRNTGSERSNSAQGARLKRPGNAQNQQVNVDK
jgi:hypothetical protein